MCAAASVCDIDAAIVEHGGAGEPEHRDTDAQSVTDSIADSVAFADRESHTNTCARHTAAGARSVLRRR